MSGKNMVYIYPVEESDHPRPAQSSNEVSALQFQINLKAWTLNSLFFLVVTENYWK